MYIQKYLQLFSQFNQNDQAQKVLQKLQYSHSWPETKVWSQEVESLLEVEPVHRDPGDVDILGEVEVNPVGLSLELGHRSLGHFGLCESAGRGAVREGGARPQTV